MNARHTHSRPGFSLVESLVALALTGFIAVLLTALVARSTATLSDETMQVNQSSQINFANATLRALLTDISVADSDIVAASDTAIVYQMTIGSGVVCDTSGGTLALAPDQLHSGAQLASWTSAPQAGDSLALLNEGASPSDADDQWSKHTITSLAHGAHRCLTSPLTDPARDAGAIAYTFGIAPTPPPQAIGRPVRVLRPARLALYNSAAEWMLGFAEFDAAANRWHTIQPVAGPLDRYTRGTSGLRFTFVDSAGTPTTPVNGAGIELQLTATSTTRRTRGLGAFADTVRSFLPLPNHR